VFFTYKDKEQLKKKKEKGTRKKKDKAIYHTYLGCDYSSSKSPINLSPLGGIHITLYY